MREHKCNGSGASDKARCKSSRGSTIGHDDLGLPEPEDENVMSFAKARREREMKGRAMALAWYDGDDAG